MGAKINERLKRARLAQGLSLEELAANLGDITKQGLSKFETGAAVPNATRLIQLARALKVKPEYFLRPDSITLAPLEFRKLASMPQYRQLQVAEKMRDHLERYVALEIALTGAPLDRLIAPQSFEVHSVEDAERVAAHLRQAWAVGQDAIADLTDLLENKGFKIVLLDVCDDFDGACAATHDNKQVLIALNGSRPGERMRFTAAHEVGHWIMKFAEQMPEKERERCCHRFAAAFLFPAAQVRVEFGEALRSRIHPQELLNAKKSYGVSMQMILYRLKDLGLLSEAGHRALSITFNKNGWRKNEPGAMPPEKPKRFESLVYRGLSENAFTLSRAAEFLQISIGKLNATVLGALVHE